MLFAVGSEVLNRIFFHAFSEPAVKPFRPKRGRSSTKTEVETCNSACLRRIRVENHNGFAECLQQETSRIVRPGQRVALNLIETNLTVGGVLTCSRPIDTVGEQRLAVHASSVGDD